MELNSYAEKAMGTALPGAQCMEYAAALIASEAGEFNGHWSKAIRDDDKYITDDRESLMLKELGDLLWGISIASWLMGYSLEEIAQMNLDKLASRKDRGVIGGSGDTR